MDLPARPGGFVTVPVSLDISSTAANVGGLDFDLFFDPTRLTIEVPGGILTGADTAGGWAFASTLVAAGHLRVGVLNAQGQPLAVGLREVARLQFHVTVAAAGESTPLDIEPLDSYAGGYSWTAVDGSLAVTVANPWHNLPLPCDVNGDGWVSPQDVLATINYLNAHPGDASLPATQETPARYYDVNDDWACTALDVLVVINYLNSRTAAATGEGEAVDVSSSRPLASETGLFLRPAKYSAVDEVWAAFGRAESASALATPTVARQRRGPYRATRLGRTHAADEPSQAGDDWDDLLDLVADSLAPTHRTFGWARNSGLAWPPVQ